MPPQPASPVTLDAQIEGVADMLEFRNKTGEPGIPDILEFVLASLRELKRIEDMKDVPEPVALRFPTMLRKMWSGGEVQDWLNSQPPLYGPEVIELLAAEKLKLAKVMEALREALPYVQARHFHTIVHSTSAQQVGGCAQCELNASIIALLSELTKDKNSI